MTAAAEILVVAWVPRPGEVRIAADDVGQLLAFSSGAHAACFARRLAAHGHPATPALVPVGAVVDLLAAAGVPLEDVPSKVALFEQATISDADAAHWATELADRVVAAVAR